jgi:hypothetical protein
VELGRDREMLQVVLHRRAVAALPQVGDAKDGECGEEADHHDGD